MYSQFVRYLNVAHTPPSPRSVEQLREAAASCQACDLWENATQTVFGEGSEHARMTLVGDGSGVPGHQAAGRGARLPFGVPVVATVHPSSILRAPDDEAREVAMSSFVADLKVAANRS